jgi:ATP-binding cassette subfamily F protein uup
LPVSTLAPRSERSSAKKKSLSNLEQRELSGLPDAIEAAEKRVSELTEALADPATYASGGREVAKLTDSLASAKAETERLTKRWEELERKQEEARA